MRLLLHRIGVVLAHRNRLVDQLLDAAQIGHLVRLTERDGDAAVSGAAGASDAVHVVFRLVGHVVVDDVRQLADVQTARGDVRRHEHADLALLEAVERVLPVQLGFVAVDGARADVGARQIVRHLVRPRLGAHEDERAVKRRVAQRVQQQLLLVLPVDEIHRLIDGLHRGGNRRHLDLGKVLLEQALDQLLHRLRHGSGKQQRLHLAVAHALQDALHVVDKAHVQHAVGLVEHEQLDVLQIDIALSAQVVEAAGRGDEHIDARAQRFRLVVLRHAAVDERAADVGILRIGDKALIDLNGQLARRREDERADGREAGQARLVFQLLQDRDDKRARLARAGLRQTEHIAPAERGGDRLLLNRRRDGIAGVRERVQQLRVDAQINKFRHIRHSSLMLLKISFSTHTVSV